MNHSEAQTDLASPQALTVRAACRFWPRYVNSAVRQRGERYHRDGRVKSLKWWFEKNTLLIFGQVQGSLARPYQCRVEINARRGGEAIELTQSCDCPADPTCKHIAALLSEFQSLGANPSTLRAEASERKSQELPSTQVQPALENQIRGWLARHPNALSTSTKAAALNFGGGCALYLVLPTKVKGSSLLHEPRLRFAIGQDISRLTPEEQSKFSRGLTFLNNQQRSLLLNGSGSPLPDPQLKVFANLFLSLEHNGQRSSPESFVLTCPNQQPAKSILDLVEAGLCLAGDHEFFPVTMGAPRQAKLDWIETWNARHYKPTLVLSEAPTYILKTEPFLYFDARNRSLGAVQTAEDYRQVSWFLSAPTLSSENFEALQSVLKENGLAEVPLPKSAQAIVIKNVKPRPILKLYGVEQEKDYFDTSKILKLGTKSKLIAIEGVAQLHFQYDSESLRYPPKAAVEVLDNPERQIIVHRDAAEEERLYAELKACDLAPVACYAAHESSSFERTPHDLNFSRRTLGLNLAETPNIQKWARFIQEEVPKLKERGWQVEIDPSFPMLRVSNISAWDSSFHAADGATPETSSKMSDVFEMTLGITVADKRLDLAQILLALAKDPLFRLQEKILVVTEDLHAIWLPTERIRPILAVLAELAEPTSQGSAISISRYQALELLKVEQWSWGGAAELQRIRKELSQFDRLKAVPVPPKLKTSLRDYQRRGLNWLAFIARNRFGGILADDMGLGKTVQAIALILHEQDRRGSQPERPVLVICPTSVCPNWGSELQRFAPHLKVHVHHGPKRRENFPGAAAANVILTTYPLLRLDQEHLKRLEYSLVIFDELQFLKNGGSQTARVARDLKAPYRVGLTGTPFENNLKELWSVFHLLMPGFLGHYKFFKNHFRNPIENYGDKQARQELKRRIAPFVLRRTKPEVALELPPKTEIVQALPISGKQRDLYESVRITMDSRVRQELADHGLAKSNFVVFEALLKLRQVCCDPRLVKESQTALSFSDCAKLEYLRAFLPELVSENRRILLFSQFTSMLDLIELELAKLKIPWLRLDGSSKDRQTPVSRFQAGAAPLFLISLKAGGTGLNLTAADTVIHYDPWWNPAVENQATDRAHRIGQNKPVFVYKLVLQGTIEERILVLQKKKQALIDKILTGETSGNLKLSEEEIKALLAPI